tara:strand:+ start:3499 stop:4530 length:1032 start_codon:yes stop_codon:yes gene_type:complete
MSNGGGVTDETIAGFVKLFRGGRIALDHKEFRPWLTPDGGFYTANGTEFEIKAADHLKTGPSIGVYPLFSEDEQLKVYWGCVDWDEGLKESYTHATNVYQVLKQLEIQSWVERSRSKGFHLWVFFTQSMSAKIVREGLIGACEIVQAPTKEVNPKQVELSERGWGNGVRLPYGELRQRGGYNEMDRPEATFSIVPVKSFVEEAIKGRITPECWEPVRALYKPPKPFKPTTTSNTSKGPLTGMSEAIRRNGPRPTEMLPKGDRSATLFSLACAMVRQRYPQQDIFDELKSADKEWGGKYDSRLDGDTQLWRIVSGAEKVAWNNEEIYQRSYRQKTESESKTETH